MPDLRGQRPSPITSYEVGKVALDVYYYMHKNITEKLASAVQGSKSKEDSYKSRNCHVDKQSVTTKNQNRA